LNGARTVAGEEYTVARLMAEVEKDLPFYEQSGGGVTLSGGEALCQIDFVEELVQACRRKGIRVAIDTCGYVPFDSFARILEDTDLFLYDLKLWDPAAHKLHTGCGNGLILANLQELRRRGANVNLRLPLVSGVNDDEGNIGGIISFAGDLGITTVNLLPYHDIGRDKYRRLSRQGSAVTMASPAEGRLEEIRRAFTVNGFAVKIGG
jgi:pyruvate formate lyase activating enzyme